MGVAGASRHHPADTKAGASQPAWASRPLYLQRWFDKRNGRERIYFRKDGVKTELTQPWGTQALADEAAQALRRMGGKPKPKPIAGALVAAVRAYRGHRDSGIPPSAEYLTLAPLTQRRYDRWLAPANRAALRCQLRHSFGIRPLS